MVGKSSSVEHQHAESTSFSKISDRKLIRSLRQSLEREYKEEDEDYAERIHSHDKNIPESQFQKGEQLINGLMCSSHLNQTDRKYCSRISQKANSQPSADGRTSENSSTTSDLNYNKFLVPLHGEINHNIDQSSFDSHSIDNSSTVSVGNGKSPSSIDSENRSELSCGRSIDSEVARYTNNMSKEGLSRYTKHNRGLSLDKQ